MLDELKPSMYFQDRGSGKFYFAFLVRIPDGMEGVLQHIPPVGGQPRKFIITVSAKPGQTNPLYSFFTETITHMGNIKDKFEYRVELNKSAEAIYSSKSLTPEPGELGGSYDDPDGYPGGF